MKENNKLEIFKIMQTLRFGGYYYTALVYIEITNSERLAAYCHKTLIHSIAFWRFEEASTTQQRRHFDLIQYWNEIVRLRWMFHYLRTLYTLLQQQDRRHSSASAFWRNEIQERRESARKKRKHSSIARETGTLVRFIIHQPLSLIPLTSSYSTLTRQRTNLS